MADVPVAEIPQTSPLDDLLQADRDDAWAYFPTLAAIYARELRRLARQAEARFHRHQWSAPLTAAGQPADWVLPDPDELIDSTKAAGDLAGKTRKVREEIAQASVGGTLAAYGINFDLRNPVMQNVLTQMGQHITQIVEEQRRTIMESLQRSWEQGLSIRDAARQMVMDSVVDSKTRGELIARTELTGATNGGSLAAVRLVNDASPAESRLTKIWIATNDDRTREAHSQADSDYGPGSGIPTDQPFIVDGEEMQHPGDPSGSAANVINCRCAIGYEQTGAAGAQPGPIPATEAAAGPSAEPFPVGGGGLPGGQSGIDRSVADAITVTRDTSPLTEERYAAFKRDGVLPADTVQEYDRAVRSYAGNPTFQEVQRTLAGERPLDPGIYGPEKVKLAEENAAALRRMFDEAVPPLRENHVMWRGIMRKGRFKVGDEFTAKGLTSTTADPYWAQRIVENAENIGKQPYVMRIRIPAGTRALNIDANWTMPYMREGELVLPPDTTFRIVAEPGTFRGARVLDVEVETPQAAALTPESLARDLVGVAKREEAQVTNDLQSIVRANGGTMGGLDFRLKTEKSLAGKLERKAREKGVTPEEYSQSVADVLRYTGVFDAPDYAAGVERTITRLRKAGYKIDNADIENYWNTGDDYNGINMTLRTRSGYRFELQFHTPESLDLKNGELHKLYEQFRDEQNPHERLRLWNRMVNLSDSLPNPGSAAERIGTRTLHKPPTLPTEPHALAQSLVEAASRRDTLVTADVSGSVGAAGGQMGGLEARVKTEASLIRKLETKGPLDPVAYSQQVADVLRYTGVFNDNEYASGVEQAIQNLRDKGYHVAESDIENYWESGDDYNGININVTTADGYRFELQFHTPESFALKNGELHRIYDEFRTSTDPFIRKQLWDQMVELSDSLPPLTWEFKETGQYADILRIGKLTRHDPPVAHGVTAVLDAAGQTSIDTQSNAYASAMRYTGSGYDDINALLRHETIGRDGPPIADAKGESAMAEVLRSSLQLLRNQVKDIESLMLPAKKPLMLYRGYKRAVLDPANTGDLTTLVGKTIEDPGFSSTTAESRTARSFAQSGASGSFRDYPDQVVMELAIPKGYPVLNVQRLQGGVGEQEIVLPPGTRYQVQSVRRDEEGRWIVRAIVEER